MATKIQLRRDLSANWVGTNPTLAQGEPGVELDTHKMKVGNGSTAWNDLAYVSLGGDAESTVENMFVKLDGMDGDTGYLDWAGVVSVSNDGLNWTPGIFNAEFTERQAWDINGAAIGGGRMVYMTYEYANDSDFSTNRVELRWAHNPFEKPQKPTSDCVRRGPHGEDITWNNVRYTGEMFVAVGYYYDNDRSDFNYPIAVYSTDGDTWTQINIDLDFVNGKIQDERTANGDDVNGLEATDVVYGADGWLITAHWGTYDNTNLSRNPAGAWYVTNLSTHLNGATWTVQIPGAWIAAFDGHGWVAWANRSGYSGPYVTVSGGPAFYFNSNSDPRTGSWSTVDYNEVLLAQTGRTDNCILSVAAGIVDGTNWIVVADGIYGALATSDQGVTWRVIQTEAYNMSIRYISDTNPVAITVHENDSPNTGEKVTISGSGILELNGTFYARYYNGAAGWGTYLYRNWDGSSFSDPVDGGSWGDTSVYVSRHITGRFGDRTVEVDDVNGLVVGMAAEGYCSLSSFNQDNQDDRLAPNTIQSIDVVNSTVTMLYPWNGHDDSSEQIDFVPKLYRSEGDGIHSIAYGNGAFVGFGWNSSSRGYKTTDMTTWTSSSRAQEALGWNQPWDDNYHSTIYYGAVTTHGALLRSDSDAVSGYTNYLSVSDTFQVNVVNGDPEWTDSGNASDFGTGLISIDPQIGHWVMGTTVSNEGYWGSAEGYWGNTSSIQSYSSGEGYTDGNDYYNSVRIQGFDYKWDFNGGNGYMYGNSISIDQNNEGYNNYNLNGDSVIEGIYFTNTDNQSDDDSTKIIYVTDGRLKLDSPYGYEGEGWSELSWDDETNYVRVGYYGTYINTEGYQWNFSEDCNGDSYGMLYQPDSTGIQTAGYWWIGDKNNDWENAYIYATDWDGFLDYTGYPTNIEIHAGNHNGDHSYLFRYDGTLVAGNGSRVQMSCYWSVGDYEDDWYYTYLASGVNSYMGGIDPKDIDIAADDYHWWFRRDAIMELPPGGDIVNSDNRSVIFDIPQNKHTNGEDYTLVYGDRNKHIYVTSAGNIYIPTNGEVSFPIGACAMVVTDSNHSTHIRTSQVGTPTLILSKFGSDADISLPADSIATLLKIDTDRWIVQIA